MFKIPVAQIQQEKAVTNTKKVHQTYYKLCGVCVQTFHMNVGK